RPAGSPYPKDRRSRPRKPAVVREGITTGTSPQAGRAGALPRLAAVGRPAARGGRVHGLVGEAVGGGGLVPRAPGGGHPAGGAGPRARAACLASAASLRRSGCLICQRPDICSTTSLESIRTSASAPGASRPAARRPASRPEYSATLLVARPMGSLTSASTSPV